MHNTSPMTGAVLAHRRPVCSILQLFTELSEALLLSFLRYLTENFALRHLIESYETQIAERSYGRRGGVSMKTCDLDDLSDDLSFEDRVREWSVAEARDC